MDDITESISLNIEEDPAEQSAEPSAEPSAELSARDKKYSVMAFVGVAIFWIFFITVGHVGNSHYDGSCISRQSVGVINLYVWILLESYIGLSIPIIYWFFYIMHIFEILRINANNMILGIYEICMVAGVVFSIIFYLIMISIGINLMTFISQSCNADMIPLCITMVILSVFHFLVLGTVSIITTR